MLIEIKERGRKKENDQSIDDLYEAAKEIVIRDRRASASYFQRELNINYTKAAYLIDLLENNKIIGIADGAKPREILI